MKKSIAIFSTLIIVFTLTAYGYYTSSNTTAKHSEPVKTGNTTLRNDFREIVKRTTNPNPDFFYKVASRFNTVISKQKLHRAKSIIDILPKEETRTKKDYESVSVSILVENDEATEFGVDEMLNPAQIALLQTTDYSTNIVVTSYCQRLDEENGTWGNYKITYHMTVVPEIEARFKEGHEGLLNYIKDKTKKLITKVDNEKLRPGRVAFTISKEATVEGVELLTTSGYSDVDQEFIKLISTTSKQWVAASNSEGEKVDQKLVLSFGKMGC